MAGTPEQRAASLLLANETRFERARAKRKLKDGQLALEDVLDATPDLLKTWKVGEMLAALPNLGKRSAESGLRSIEINPQRPVGALTLRQRRLIYGWFA